MEVEITLSGGEWDGNDPPINSKVGPQLRHKPLAAKRLPLLLLKEITKLPRRGGKRQNPYQRAQWSDRALEMAIEAINNGHSYSKVSVEYKILRYSLRNHMNGKTRSRKMGPKGVFKSEEEIALYHYIEEMVDCGLSLSPTQLIIKVGEMTEDTITPFKNGILGRA